MRRIALLLGAYVRRSFLQWMAMRAFLFSLVVNQAVTPLLGFAVWSVALPGAPEISTYYLVVLVVQLMTVSYEHHTFSNDVYDGRFALELVKPQPHVLTPLGENVAMRIWHLAIGVPLFMGLWLASAPDLDGRRLLLSLPAMLLAAALRFLFTYTLAMTAFWTQQAHGAIGFGETLIFLLGGVAVPIALFPERLRDLAAWLPFRAMLGFPAEIAAGGLTPSAMLAGYGWQVGWLAAGAGLASVVWRRGVRRYAAVGG